MKNLTAILLAVLMLITLIASCGGNDATTTTEIPTTEAPTTESLTTEAPTTETPTTETPTTEAPTTEAPTTEAPTTEAPTTEVPTTDNNDNINNVENPWDPILHVKEFGPVDSRFNYKNILDKDTKYFDNSDNVDSKVTININNKDITLYYEESYYDKMLGSFINRYKKKMDGESNYSVRLYEDGTIKMLSKSDGLTSIEIPENATSEEILPFAKEFLSQYTELSQYNSTEYEVSDLGDHTFNFYSMVNGYITGKADIYISAEGKITRVMIEKIQNEITSLNVDKEKIYELLIKRIKDIYTTKSVEFISCEINKEYTRAYIINDKIYLYYYSDVKYKFKGESTENTATPTFLVPYELVKAEE